MGVQPALGQRVRDLRIERGLSQAQLALPELSDSYISLLEAGKREPSPQVVAILTRKLGCGGDYLLTGLSTETINELTTDVEYAQIALDNGEGAEARDRLADVLAHPRIGQLADLKHQARSAYARALEACGDLDEAISLLREMIGELAPLLPGIMSGERVDQNTHLYIDLCRVLRVHGDLAEAIGVGEAAIESLTDEGREWRETTVMLGASVLAAYIERGDLTYGRVLAGSLIRHARDIGTHRALMAAYWNAAWVAHGRGDPELAVKLSQRALAHLGELNDERLLAGLHMAHARFTLEAYPDRAREALGMLTYTETSLRSCAGTRTDIAECHEYMARAHLILKQPDLARSFARQTLDELGEIRGAKRAGALTALARASIQLRLPHEATAALGEAIEILDEMEASRNAAQAWYELADILAQAGDSDRECFAIRQALACMNL